MSTTTTFTADQAQVYGVLVGDPRHPVDLDYSEAIDLLEALPSGTVFGLELPGFGRQDRWRLMARDMPGVGRRFTNLDTGTEWIGLNDIVARNPSVYGVGIWTSGFENMLGMCSTDNE